MKYLAQVLRDLCCVPMTSTRSQMRLFFQEEMIIEAIRNGDYDILVDLVNDEGVDANTLTYEVRQGDSFV